MKKIDYNAAAAQYAANRRIHAGVFQNLLETRGLNESQTVLEVGCGTGNYIIALQETTGCAAYGIDPSEGMLAKARERGAAAQLGLGRAEEIPFSDGMFDLVFSVDVIHHVQDRGAYYREALRVLRPGGRVCTVTDSEDIIRRREPLATYFPESVAVELQRYPSMDELRGLMDAAGFSAQSEALVETRRELVDITAYREKAFSSLHLISEAAFQRGIARMEADLQNGPLPWVSRYILLWAVKN